MSEGYKLKMECSVLSPAFQYLFGWSVGLFKEIWIYGARIGDIYVDGLLPMLMMFALVFLT